MEHYNWENAKKEIFDIISLHMDKTSQPGKNINPMFEVEKCNTILGKGNDVYMISLYDYQEFSAIRIGTCLALLKTGNEIEFYGTHDRKEPEHYIVLHGEGEFIELADEYTMVKRSILQKGNRTSNQEKDNYHYIINTGYDPLIIFVSASQELVEEMSV